MKKWIVWLLILVMSMSMQGCKEAHDGVEVPSYTFTEEGDFEVVNLGNVTLKIENGAVDEKDMDYTAMKVEEAAEAADAFLGEYAVTESVICYVHGGDGATNLYANEIHIFYPENQNIPYILLMTQSKAGIAGVPDWLRIGLGAYAADSHGESLLDTWARTIDVYEQLPRETSEGKALTYDLNALAKILMDQNLYPTAMSLDDMTDAIAGFSEAQEAYDFRGAYCVYAGSFVQYLEEQYGREAVMKLYYGSTMEEVTGYTRDEVLQSWMHKVHNM